MTVLTVLSYVVVFGGGWWFGGRERRKVAPKSVPQPVSHAALPPETPKYNRCRVISEGTSGEFYDGCARMVVTR